MVNGWMGWTFWWLILGGWFFECLVNFLGWFFECLFLMFSFGCRGKEPLADIYENTWNSLKVVLPSMATCFPFWWSSLQTNREEGSCGTVGRFGDVGCDGLWWPCFFATCNLHGNCTPTKKTSLFKQNFPWNFAGFFTSVWWVLRWRTSVFEVPVLITRTVCQAAWLNRSWNLRKMKALLVPLAGSVESYPYPDTPQISPNNDKLYIIRVSVKTQWSSGLALFWTNKSIFQKISADKNVIPPSWDTGSYE